MHDSNGRKLVKFFNEACLLLNNGRIKHSYVIAHNRCKISAFNIFRIHLPYILHIGMPLGGHAYEELVNLPQQLTRLPRFECYITFQNSYQYWLACNPICFRVESGIFSVKIRTILWGFILRVSTKC